MRQRQRWAAATLAGKLLWCAKRTTGTNRDRYCEAIMWIEAAMQGAGIL